MTANISVFSEPVYRSSSWRTFWRVTFPLVVPGIVSIAIGDASSNTTRRPLAKAMSCSAS
mgnify:CR=1 FL=1